MERRPSPARRLALVGTALLLLVGLTGCNDGKAPIGRGPVATVEGRTITIDDVTEITDALSAFVEASAAAGGDGVDQAQVDTALARYRGVNEHTLGTAGASEALSALVKIEVLSALLADAGGEVTDADRTTAGQQIQQQLSQAGVEANDEIQPIIDAETELAALATALERALIDPAEREAQLREVFDANADAFALVCIQQIATLDQAGAEEAATRIEAGEDFAAVAGDLSEQPELAVPGEESSCLERSRLAGVFPEEAATAATGDVIGPADAQGAWLLVRIWDERQMPFEQARAQLEEQVPHEGQAEASARVAEAYAAADVHIDARYGTWDPEQGAVVAPYDPLADAS